MYCPSLVHIGDKDTFYPFYPGTERKNKQPNKINLACCLQKHKENRCLLCSPCTSLRVLNSKGIAKETENSVMFCHIIIQVETQNQGEYRQPQQILVQCNAHVTRLKIRN